MWLLDTRKITLRQLDGLRVPPYAILSHRWEDEEVLFRDMAGASIPTHKKGYAKLAGACTQALKDGFEWIWIDTCCIDKSSSAELSEAINSMFRWSQQAGVCYVFLCDVGTSDPNELAKSSWFTRGWTLQELIAPREVIFYDKNWLPLYRKSTSAELLSNITNIHQDVLLGGNFRQLSIATRMSWAAKRRTTRVEDEAYSLMGLFDVNMPLLYGEGARAFRRLQEEIIKNSHDHSILAWGMTTSTIDIESDDSFLAKSPAAFSESRDVVAFNPRSADGSIPYSITNRGLNIQLPLIRSGATGETGYDLALLNCRKINEPFKQLAVPMRLRDWRNQNGEFSRLRMALQRISVKVQSLTVSQPIIMTAFFPLPGHELMFGNKLKFWLRTLPLEDQGFRLVEVYPSSAWDSQTKCLSSSDSVIRRSVVWKAAIRFQTPKGNDLLVTFQHSPDNGGGPRPMVACYTIDRPSSTALSAMCIHTSEFYFNVDQDLVSASYNGIQLRWESEFLLGQDICVVDIMTLPMRRSWGLEIGRCAIHRSMQRVTRSNNVDETFRTTKENRLISVLENLITFYCSIILITIAWWIQSLREQPARRIM